MSAALDFQGDPATTKAQSLTSLSTRGRGFVDNECYGISSVPSQGLRFSFADWSSLQVIQEFRPWLNSAHKQSIARPGTGNIQQLPFGLVDVIEVHLVGNRFDALL